MGAIGKLTIMTLGFPPQSSSHVPVHLLSLCSLPCGSGQVGALRLTSSFKKGRSRSRVAQLVETSCPSSSLCLLSQQCSGQNRQAERLQSSVRKASLRGPCGGEAACAAWTHLFQDPLSSYSCPQPVLIPVRPCYQPAQLWWQH